MTTPGGSTHMTEPAPRQSIASPLQSGAQPSRPRCSLSNQAPGLANRRGRPSLSIALHGGGFYTTEGA